MQRALSHLRCSGALAGGVKTGASSNGGEAQVCISKPLFVLDASGGKNCEASSTRKECGSSSALGEGDVTDSGGNEELGRRGCVASLLRLERHGGLGFGQLRNSHAAASGHESSCRSGKSGEKDGRELHFLLTGNENTVRTREVRSDDFGLNLTLFQTCAVWLSKKCQHFCSDLYSVNINRVEQNVAVRSLTGAKSSTWGAVNVYLN